nr:selenocysteine lyase-like isoform X2 [Paramormyrops kingsleyae]
MGDAVVGIPNKDQQALVEQTVSNCRDQEERIYMDYNATTPLDPEVIMAITEALKDAWGNPSSTYLPGRKAKGINDKSRESVASMVNGQAEDIIFMSGGTEANNLVFYTAVKHFWDSWGATLLNEKQTTVLPHIITSSIEHDSVKITADSLLKEGKADRACNEFDDDTYP